MGLIPPERNICRIVAEMCAGLVERELAGGMGRGPVTAGERLYHAGGVRGARGQAQDGYPILREKLLPVLRRSYPWGPARFRAGCLDALLLSMMELEDSCLLARGGPEGLALVQRGAARILALGGPGSEPGSEAMVELERQLMVRHLSPGGSADLLAAGIFLVSAEVGLAELTPRQHIA